MCGCETKKACLRVIDERTLLAFRTEMCGYPNSLFITVYASRAYRSRAASERWFDRLALRAE
jgi:hypothetical protein